MDIVTAKILVSAVLVVAVVAFSLFSFEMGISHIVRDFKAGRQRLAADGKQGE